MLFRKLRLDKFLPTGLDSSEIVNFRFCIYCPLIFKQILAREACGFMNDVVLCLNKDGDTISEMTLYVA